MAALKKLELSPCRAPLWATNGHVQTILGHLLPSPEPGSPGEAVVVPVSDGDHLAGRYHAGTSDLVVYLFHGLGGSADADYMKRTVRLCEKHGHSVYRMNHRGCGEGANLARHPYHSGRGDDVSAVVEFGRLRHPGKRHLCIGFSLSGSALLNLLTGLRGSCLPDYAITVNAPLDLRGASQLLGRGLNRIYDLRFIRQMQKDLRNKFERGFLSTAVSVPMLSRIYDFDQIYTARASGFRDREHYYESCSTLPHLHRISVPTVLLTAEDDPFVPFQDYAGAKLSSSSVVQNEAVGGHMGYVSADPLPTGARRWLDYALDAYVVSFDKLGRTP